MKNLLFVGLGGMIGSILRYIISRNVSGYFGSFPFGIFLVNILGCFLAGIIVQYAINSDKDISNFINLFLIIGFCGGFTTFSAFTIDIVSLINQNKILLVMLYISLTTIFGILFCYLGMNIFK
jgi:CrcB protein